MDSFKRFARELMRKVGMDGDEEIRTSEKRRLSQLQQAAQNSEKENALTSPENQDNSLKGLMPETRVNRTRSLTHLLTSYWNMQPAAKVPDADYVPVPAETGSSANGQPVPVQESASDIELKLQDITPFVKVSEQEHIIHQLYLQDAEQKTIPEKEQSADVYDLDGADTDTEYFPDNYESDMYECDASNSVAAAKTNSHSYSEVEKLYGETEPLEESLTANSFAISNLESLSMDAAQSELAEISNRKVESDALNLLRREIAELREESEVREITLSLAETVLECEMSNMQTGARPWAMAMEESEQEIDQVLENSDWCMVLRIAENSSTPPRVLERLVEYPNIDVRIALADNSATPEDVLVLLARDLDHDVRYALAENHNVPKKVLEILGVDENPYVSSRAQKTMARLACGEVFERNFGSEIGNRGIRIAQ